MSQRSRNGVSLHQQTVSCGTITIEGAGELVPLECDLYSTNGQPGDEILFDHTIENTGPSGIEGSVTISVGGLFAREVTAFVNGGSTETVTTVFTIPDGIGPGSHTVEMSVGGSSIACGVVTVEQAGEVGNLQVAGCSVSPQDADPSTEVTVTVEVENTGDVALSGTVSTSVGGFTYAASEEVVQGGQTQTFTSSFTPQELDLGGGDHGVEAQVGGVSMASMQPAHRQTGGCHSCGSDKNGSKRLSAFQSGMGGLL